MDSRLSSLKSTIWRVSWLCLTKKNPTIFGTESLSTVTTILKYPSNLSLISLINSFSAFSSEAAVFWMRAEVQLASRLWRTGISSHWWRRCSFRLKAGYRGSFLFGIWGPWVSCWWCRWPSWAGPGSGWTPSGWASLPAPAATWRWSLGCCRSGLWVLRAAAPAKIWNTPWRENLRFRPPGGSWACSWCTGRRSRRSTWSCWEKGRTRSWTCPWWLPRGRFPMKRWSWNWPRTCRKACSCSRCWSRRWAAWGSCSFRARRRGEACPSRPALPSARPASTLSASWSRAATALWPRPAALTVCSSARESPLFPPGLCSRCACWKTPSPAEGLPPQALGYWYPPAHGSRCQYSPVWGEFPRWWASSSQLCPCPWYRFWWWLRWSSRPACPIPGPASTRQKLPNPGSRESRTGLSFWGLCSSVQPSRWSLFPHLSVPSRLSSWSLANRWWLGQGSRSSKSWVLSGHLRSSRPSPPRRPSASRCSLAHHRNLCRLCL